MLSMEHILEDTVSSEDLKKYEQKYHEELQHGKISATSQFEYAWCLVRSRYPADIRKGIILLEDLFQNQDETNKRDYLYYLAIGNTKLKSTPLHSSMSEHFYKLNPEIDKLKSWRL